MRANAVMRRWRAFTAERQMTTTEGTGEDSQPKRDSLLLAIERLHANFRGTCVAVQRLYMKPSAKRDAQHDVSRRALIKWTVATGAALGLARSKTFDILEKVGGKQLAQAAAENPTRRSVSLIAGEGGLAWFTLLWPQPEIALAANPALSWHKPGMAQAVPGTRNLVIGPDTPFANLPAGRQMTCFTAGANLAHTANPPLMADLNNTNVYEAFASLQAVSPSVVPLVAIGAAPRAPAVGGAPVSRVGTATGIVDLFNSAASRANGILAKASDAQLYKAQYEVFAQLNRAAVRTTQRSAYQTATTAAGFLGTNLAAKLAITQADLTRYGVNGNMVQTVADIARAFIIAVKAFKFGLTNAIVMPAMNDDPHTAFTAGGVNIIPAQLKLVFDAFMADLTATTDDVTGKVLADDTVITITGDTTKSCVIPRGGAGWDDSSPGNTNAVFIYSAGDLKAGWWGGISPNGNVQGFAPNGQPAAYNQATTARIALASAAYAIVKRDERAISRFANGTTISDVFGYPKNQ
jgi:hypothetical protein